MQREWSKAANGAHAEGESYTWYTAEGRDTASAAAIVIMKPA